MKYYLVFVLLIIGFLLGNVIGHAAGFRDGYIKACSDVQAGKAAFKLVDNPDGSRTWTQVVPTLAKK